MRDNDSMTAIVRAADTFAPDPICAAATDDAWQAVLADHGPEAVGGHLGIHADDERVVTHRFACTMPGYPGWEWHVSVTRPKRSRSVTVNEVTLATGPESLVPQAWVPWSERLRPGDLTPGTVVPTAPDEARLAPGWSGDDDLAGELDPGPLHPVNWEPGIQRTGSRRPSAASPPRRAGTPASTAHAARWPKPRPATCVSCGWMLTIGGPLGPDVRRLHQHAVARPTAGWCRSTTVAAGIPRTPQRGPRRTSPTLWWTNTPWTSWTWVTPEPLTVRPDRLSSQVTVEGHAPRSRSRSDRTGGGVADADRLRETRSRRLRVQRYPQCPLRGPVLGVRLRSTDSRRCAAGDPAGRRPPTASQLLPVPRATPWASVSTPVVAEAGWNIVIGGQQTVPDPADHHVLPVHPAARQLGTQARSAADRAGQNTKIRGVWIVALQPGN